MTLYQQRPPTVAAAEGAEGGNDQASGHVEDGAEESKQRGNDIKMEGLGETEGGAAGDDGNNQDGRNRGYNARRRLTLEEYEEQFRQRVAAEMQVFNFAIAKVETLIAKNVHMESFMLRLFRDVETSYVTTADTQQCSLQTIQLGNEQLSSLVRLL